VHLERFIFAPGFPDIPIIHYETQISTIKVWKKIWKNCSIKLHKMLILLIGMPHNYHMNFHTKFPHKIPHRFSQNAKDSRIAPQAKGKPYQKIPRNPC